MITLGNSKLIASVLLGFGSAIISLSALFFSNSCASRVKWRRSPLTISMGLCFGAGVLLATAFNHILPEVREEIPDIAEILICTGFFLLYFVDELVHLLSPQHSHSHNDSLKNNNNITVEEEEFSVTRPIELQAYKRPSIIENGTGYEMVPSSRCTNELENLPNHRALKGSTSKSTSTFSKQMGLILALTVHSVLEGLAIGLEMSSDKVMLLLLAVSCHKFLVSLCLGIELATQHPGQFHMCSWVVGQLLIFSFASAFGVGLGAILVEFDSIDTTHGPLVPSLQALAGGSLLYVTMCEVLPRERQAASTGDAHYWPKYSGILLNISLILGYLTMLFINYLLS